MTGDVSTAVYSDVIKILYAVIMISFVQISFLYKMHVLFALKTL